MAAAHNPARGEAHYNAKLTDHECRLVLELVAERAELIRKARELSDAKLAEKFDVHPHTIYKIHARIGRLDATMRRAQGTLI